MSVLVLLAMQVISAIHPARPSPEFAGYNDSEIELNATCMRGKTNRWPRRRRIRRKRGGRRDRTAWGSYTESAPPVLPSNAGVPGFENEMLSTAISLRKDRRQGAEDEWDDGDDVIDEEFENDDEDTHHDESGMSEDHAQIRRRDVRSTRDIEIRSIRTAVADALVSLPTSFASSLFSAPSALFGSTTRPAERTLLLTPPQTHHTSFEAETESSVNFSDIPGAYTVTNVDFPVTLQERSDLSVGSRLTMASNTRLWISLWFLLTAPVIFWDAGFCFMRPRSFTGGDLHWIWKPYSLYQEVDYVYGVEAYARGDGFANAQSLLNVIETLCNLFYLYLQHVQQSPSAPIVGLSAAVMTFSKTVLYWSQELFCGGCSVGHNDLNTLFWLWILPNGLWLLFPSLIIYSLSKDLSHALNLESKKSVSSQKKEN